VSNIVHLARPQQSSATVDVLSLQPGQVKPYGMTLIGSGSYGDWTAYVVRTMQNALATFPSRVRARCVVGHGDVAVDAVIAPEVAANAQSIRTWQVYHVVGSEIRLDIEVVAIAGAKPTADRLVAWIAPGRPSLNYVRHALVANGSAVNPIPTFAVALELQVTLANTASMEWYDDQGILLETTFLTASATDVPVAAKIPISPFARTVALVGPGWGPGNTTALWHVYA
jgi:hypothetical protein